MEDSILLESTYGYWKKVEVIHIFFEEWKEFYPSKPNLSKISCMCKVMYTTVQNYITKFKKYRCIIDPNERKWVNTYTNSKISFVYWKLSLEEEAYIMPLHAKDLTHPN